MSRTRTAGVLFQATSVTDLDLDEWNRVLAVDLTGVMLTFRATVPHFGPEGGLLLATGSSLAVRPGTGLLPYVRGKGWCPRHRPESGARACAAGHFA